MPPNLTKDEIFDFIRGDFRDAWTALASVDTQTAGHRGNFLFARQAMNLLEAAALLCSSDAGSTKKPPEGPLRDFSDALFAIDPLYFTELPNRCGDNRDFRLPSRSKTPGAELLWAMFDLIRHGLAHQYQQAIVQLTDQGTPGVFFAIQITGAMPGRTLDHAQTTRPPKHLGYKRDGDTLWLHVRTDRLFVDIEKAIGDSSLLTNAGLHFPHMTRPRVSSGQSFSTGAGPYYDFDSHALEGCLAAAQHPKL